MPDFEAACLCLAETSPSALPLFVSAASALAAATPCHEAQGKPAHDQMHLAQRALNVLQPALDGSAPPLYACRAALRAAICSHAELLCLAGRPAAGMWLALHPTDASDGQPDWATAVRLLERECATGDSCNSREGSLLAVPLMFEVLALRVCETLAPDDDDLLGLEPEDESEALAACVAHLFIAAKTVGAAVRRNASANPSAVRASQPRAANHLNPSSALTAFPTAGCCTATRAAADCSRCGARFAGAVGAPLALHSATESLTSTQFELVKRAAPDGSYRCKLSTKSACEAVTSVVLVETPTRVAASPQRACQRRELLFVNQRESMREVHEMLETCVQMRFCAERDHHVPVRVIDVGIHTEKPLEDGAHSIDKRPRERLLRSLREYLRRPMS